MTLQQSHFPRCFKRAQCIFQLHPLVIAQVVSEWGNSDSEGAKACPRLLGQKERRDSKSYILFNMSHVELHALTKISSEAWPSLTDSPFNCCCNCPMAWGRSWWNKPVLVFLVQHLLKAAVQEFLLLQLLLHLASNREELPDLAVPVGLTLSSLFLPLSFRGYNLATKNDLVWDLLKLWSF